MEVQADRRDLPRDPRLLKHFSLADLIIRYRDTVTPKKRGADAERRALQAFLRQAICEKRLSELSSSDFANYRDQRLNSAKAATVKRMLAVLHHIFGTARDEWQLPFKENPLDKVKLNCPSNRRERRLRDGELERIIEAAKKTRNRVILPIILFALETGLRRSEILSARWLHLDQDKRLLRLPVTKNGHSRSIPLSLSALALLQGLRREKDKEDDEERIFPVTANGLRLSWERLRNRAGIDGLRFHDLRHEAISRFFETGLTAPEVALMSGHRDMRMLFRYSHAKNLEIIRKMDRCSRELTV
jgi:integrase